MMIDSPETLDAVTRQQQRTLAAYRAKPSQIRTDANGEQKERREYAKRTILELLQNAEDALSDADRHGRVLLRLIGNSLIVANEGAPFSDRGFQALCTLDDSAKQTERSGPSYHRKIASKGTGFKAVLNWTDRIALRSEPIMALFDRSKAAPMIRGALDPDGITELDKEGYRSDEDMPLLHVPLPLAADAKLEKLSRDQWDTVFRLRVVPEKLDDVVTALQDIDPRQWLFLERVAEVQVDINESSTVWRFDREEALPFGDGGSCYQLTVRKDRHPLAQYHVLRQRLPECVKPANEYEVGVAEVGYAYQVDGDEPETPARIANYFATDYPSPFPAIAIHGTFLLKADRSRLAEDDLDYQRQLIDALCELACARLIPELVAKYGAGALAYLESSPGDRADTDGASIESDVREQLIVAVGNIRFVPTIAGSYASPNVLRLWKHGLGKLLAAGPTADRHHNLPTADWCDDSARSVLSGLAAKDLDPVEHAKLLKDWQPPSADAACAAHELLADAYGEISWPLYFWNETRDPQDRFKRVAGDLPIWLTSRGGYRALNNRVPFFEPRKSHNELPNVLKLDWLDSAFLETLKKRKLWGQSFVTELRKDKLHSSARDDVLRHGILQGLKIAADWWERHGFEVLRTLMEFGFAADETSDVSSNSLREEVSRRLQVPTRDAGWQNAGIVYAGKDWDNPWAEGFVSASSGKRFLLAAPSDFPDEADWESVLRYCGVSWSPKWQHHKHQDRDGNGPTDYQELKKAPEAFYGIGDWEDFWISAGVPPLEAHLERKQDSGIKRFPLLEAWAIEGLQDFITGFDGNVARLKALRQVWESEPSRRKIGIGLRGPNGRKIGTLKLPDQESFLAWQIKRAAVFEFPHSPLFQGRATLSDLLVGGRSDEAWLKWLPRLSFAGIDDKERHALSGFALDFDAKERPQTYSVAHWRQWLLRLVEWSFDEPPIKELKDMMHALANWDVDLSEWGFDIRLPCQTQGGLKWTPDSRQ